MLAAVVLLGAATAAQPFANHWLVIAKATHDWTAAQLGVYLLAAGAVIGLVRAVAYALLLTAVFIDRSSRKTSSATGIQPVPRPDAL